MNTLIHRRRMLALLAAGTLAGCTMDAQQIPFARAPVPEPVVDQLMPVSYAAIRDGNFTVPARDPARIDDRWKRHLVANPLPGETPGTILIDTAARHLYLVQDQNSALRYGIGVGKSGFGWTGETVLERRARWPTWTPPPEMIKRTPSLEKWKDGQPGGPSNPLGARALYLYRDGHDTGFRIHGTPEWRSIGTNSSSGCFRMIHQDVMDLYERVPNGAKVIVR